MNGYKVYIRMERNILSVILFPKKRITIQLRMKENNYVKNVILRSKEFGLETLHEMKPVNKKWTSILCL